MTLVRSLLQLQGTLDVDCCEFEFLRSTLNTLGKAEVGKTWLKNIRR